MVYDKFKIEEGYGYQDHISRADDRGGWGSASLVDDQTHLLRLLDWAYEQGVRDTQDKMKDALGVR